jgi:hypothetical protein
LDNFNRANGTLGSNWGGVIFNTGNTALEIRSQHAAGVTSSYNSNYWSASQMGPDAEVYADVPTVTANNDFIYVMLRITQPNGGGNGYRVRVDKQSGTDVISIQRVDNATSTTLGATFSQEVSNGDAIGLRAVGTTLTAYYKPASGSWVALGSRTDSTYTTAGYIGLGVYGSTGRLDNFGGGTKVASNAVPARYGLAAPLRVTTTTTKYYYFGSQRVAMRNASGVTYLHGDHLGSTSVTSGAVNSTQTYYPYGAVRTTSGTHHECQSFN